MKILRTLALAAVLVAALFGISAFVDIRAVADAWPAAAKADSVSLLSNKQVPPVQQVTAFERADLVLIANKQWVRERVGTPPLNIYRVTQRSVYELDGYSDVQIKPKITCLGMIGFRGLGHDHYARADV